ANQLLRHVRNSEIYWFCRSCWQEMPLVELSCGLEAIAPRELHVINGASNVIVSALRLGRRTTASPLETAGLVLEIEEQNSPETRAA
ncbi:MAG: hypothetical protein HC824_13770, partial [Synechococcales cyanobacterium RM1_1_8]|nr:hypothetical protein [Synechococcales cyanobacterium RM1_1_8]